MYKKFLLSGLIATLHFGGGVCSAAGVTPDEQPAESDVAFEESISDEDRYKDFPFSMKVATLRRISTHKSSLTKSSTTAAKSA